ncbi:MAG TPA: hypothetical protein VF834_23805 [Streptosporangiaceae bacterium]
MDTEADGASARQPLREIDFDQKILIWSVLSVPVTIVLAWYLTWAAGLPPHGSLGRWVAFGIAALYGLSAFWAWFFSAYGLAQRRPTSFQPLRRPARELVRIVAGVIFVHLCFDIPLWFLIAIVKFVVS